MPTNSIAEEPSKKTDYQSVVDSIIELEYFPGIVADCIKCKDSKNFSLCTTLRKQFREKKCYEPDKERIRRINEAAEKYN